MSCGVCRAQIRGYDGIDQLDASKCAGAILQLEGTSLSATERTAVTRLTVNRRPEQTTAAFSVERAPYPGVFLLARKNSLERTLLDTASSTASTKLIAKGEFTSDPHFDRSSGSHIRGLMDTDAAIRKLARLVALSAATARVNDELPKIFSVISVRFPEVVAGKFHAHDQAQTVWRSALIPVDQRSSPVKCSLRQVIDTFDCDLREAAAFVDSPDETERSLAAACFYAAVNELLWIAGVDTLCLDPSSGRPEASSKIRPCRTGGLAVQEGTPGVLSAWNLAAYNPKTNLTVFPDKFAVRQADGQPFLEAGMTPFETLLDLADMLTALGKFLKETRVGGPLAKFFGQQFETDRIFDSESSIIFPSSVRVVAMSLITAILNNLSATNKGHFEGGVQGYFGYVTHDWIEPTGRAGFSSPSTVGVARILLALRDAADDVKDDPDVPADMQKALGDGDIQMFGLVGLEGHAQGMDGGFLDFEPRESWNDPSGWPRHLLVNAACIRALTRAYELSPSPVLRLGIVDGWRFLDCFWKGDNVIPCLTEGSTTQQVSPSELWELLKLYNQSQGNIRADLSQGREHFDWSKWDQRFGKIKDRLIQQLQTDTGPVGLAECSP
jgi:hypothetical protein